MRGSQGWGYHQTLPIWLRTGPRGNLCIWKSVSRTDFWDTPSGGARRGGGRNQQVQPLLRMNHVIDYIHSRPGPSLSLDFSTRHRMIPHLGMY